jgi:hypothetical protein
MEKARAATSLEIPMKGYPARAGKVKPHRRASPSMAISVADGFGGVRSRVL